ncbi:hypothetical protein NDU88_002736 [Pleurodeles waltl]|uniref:Uncharacterized protein n=1 Tax=Pleurodeles waltl TaxID=8319 RepID=A0AAV7KT04_PLEWA|nr:hypothetical protein NDU88_002736 [Pleurodeles waltl]
MCCFCNGTNLRLEESQPAPPEGTPNRDMYVKHGLSSIMYSTLWNKYTRRDPELRWPMHGSFDLRKIEEKERKLQVTGQYTVRQPLYPILNKPHDDLFLLDHPPPPYVVPSAPHELPKVSSSEQQKMRDSRSMLPANRASELRSIARKTICSVVSASELLDNTKGWTEKEQLYFTEAFGSEVIELYRKYSDELEPDDVAADHKQMCDGLFVFSQVADAIRRLMKLRIVAVRLQEEKRAADAVARASQTEGAQASIFETDKTMIVQAKPMREAAPLYVPPKGLGTNDDKTSVDVKGYFIYNWVYTPWNRADVMALKTALPDPRKNPAAFYEEVEGAISSCTMTLADIDLFFGLILPPDMWRTVRKIDDRTVFGASWKEIEQMDGDREPAKKPYQLILDLPAAILVKLKMIIPPKKIDWTVLASC